MYSKYEAVQDEIECLEDCDEQALQDRDTVENKYYTLIGQLQKIIASRESHKSQRNSEISALTHSTQNLPPVKLPDIQIPTFTGKISDWTSFNELFSALIINNDRLTDVQRFMYLKGYLSDEPLKLISNLQLTNDNFAAALKILEDRYSNKIAIINTHIKDLLEIPSLTKINSQTLRDFFDPRETKY
ncbi:hypothetical protein NQ317_016288 [Molorchus minor]|uniref:Uncharacterized protein n=1 Tax=Molorchus minor TaxID=1323400 RepID=A0ABQ9J7B1_9CUCU|nr:hypothetical protein NQ317_016288 [Molorchus minor]